MKAFPTNLKLILILLVSLTERGYGLEDVTIKQDFLATVAGVGDEYFILREKVLSYGEEAKPILLEASKSERVEDRVISKALLKWMNEPEGARIRKCEGLDFTPRGKLVDPNELTELGGVIRGICPWHVYERLGYIVNNTSRNANIRGPLETASIPVQRTDEAYDRLQISWPHDVYLLEAAWKGFPKQFGEKLEHLNIDLGIHVARIKATSLAGVSPSSDTAPLMIKLLETDESEHVKEAAAMALGLCNDNPLCVPALLRALKSSNRMIRMNAYLSLAALTKDDLGKDRWRDHIQDLGPDEVADITMRVAKWQEAASKAQDLPAPLNQ